MENAMRGLEGRSVVVAGAVVFFAGDAAACITGQLLGVSGGPTMNG